jgi:hypothetical protein
LFVDSSGLGFEASFYRNQRLPEIMAREVRSGTLGNDRSDGGDLSDIAVAISRIETDNLEANVGMHETHRISCTVAKSTEMANGSFVLSFLDRSLWVGANTSVVDLKYNLERLHPILAEGVTVRLNGSSSSATVCQRAHGAVAEITFHHVGTLPALVVQQGSMVGVQVVITERTQGIDSVRYDESAAQQGQAGRYEVTFTLLSAGNYMISASIENVDVGVHRSYSPLLTLLKVLPAEVSAPYVTHTARAAPSR